jgi:uncharacterized protein (TIGR02145 family)
MKKNLYSVCLLLFICSVILSACSKDETEDSESFNFPTGTVTDHESNTYGTVTIDGREWMSENLRTTTYCDGDPIPADLSINWFNVFLNKTPAYAVYDNIASNALIYGNLYNWYAVNNTKNICPCGWRVATEEDWISLIKVINPDYPLSPSYNTGGKLKATGTTLWNAPNEGATNSTGFSALPGGFPFLDEFGGLGTNGYFWSSTTYTEDINDDSYAWSLDVNYQTHAYYFAGHPKVNGYSVRCIKN